MSSKPKTTATKEEATPALVPKLRFPEFRNAEGWTENELGNVCEILNNRRRPITGSERQPGPYPYYGASGIVDFVGDFIFNERLLLVGEDGAKWGAFERTAFIAEGEYWVNNHAHVLKPIAIADTLLENYLTMIDLAPFVTGAAPPKLTLGKLKGIPVPVPPTTDEQQKISECLSSVEELIAAQARKLDALKTHKKGLMQQLFPREGETQPRLRFPEFQTAGEWQTKALGQLAAYENGKAYEKHIAENGKYVVVNSRFISTDGAVRKYTNAEYLIAEAGEVLMVLSDLPKGRALAKCYFVEANDRYAVNQRVCRLRPNNIDGNFLYYALNRHPRLLAFDDGLNQTHLSKGAVTECPLCVPSDEAEQQRIATCLSSLDALITAETQKHEALKTHKKGLMQQLFPSPEEATP
jgi:type I restriction enzyme S subunit